jgi:LmbE family N-acetylglucosaminyl deacetylase
LEISLPEIHRLIVSPHADDEVLGCGGLLAKYPEDTAVVVLAEPDEIRIKEFLEAQAILGYEQAYFGNFADGYVGADMRKLVGMLDDLLNRLQPAELYLPYPASHQDHIAAYEAGVRSARLSMGSRHWYPPVVRVYDICAYDVNLYQTGLQWNSFLSLTSEQIDKKVQALEMYSSQAVEGFHPVNGIKTIAAALGASRQISYAEQYSLIREVV